MSSSTELQLGRLNNKVAIVTGGASPLGFGAAISRRFVTEGAKVIIGDLDASGAESVAASLSSPNVKGVAMNVTSEEDWKSVVNMAVSEFGRLDIVATMALAAEYGPDQIRVNAIAPLLSATGLFESFVGVKDTQENRDKFAASIPLGRLTDPVDVGNACVFLASDEGKFVTGTNFSVDGGRHI
ncbi:hypothetical protein VTO58DRAFT_110632 [Aureobasidium pullulans]